MSRRGSVEGILLKGTFAKTVQLSLTFVFHIALVPVFLTFWGAEKYGIWLTVYSLYELLMALDFGHGSYISNEFNKLYHSDKEKARKVLGSAVLVAFLSGLLELIIVIILLFTGVLDHLFTSETEHFTGLVWGVISLITFRMFFGSIKGIIVKILYPSGQLNKSMYIGTFETFALMVVLLIGAFANWSVAEVCFVVAGSKSLIALGTFVLIARWEPNFFPWWKSADLRTGLRNYGKSLVLVFNQFLERFIIYGINLVVTGTLGASVLPIFTTTKTLANFATRVTRLITVPLQPEFTRFHAQGKFSNLIEAFKANWLLMGLILNLPFVILMFFVEDLYVVWTRGKLEFDQSLFAFLGVAVLLLNYGSNYMTYLKSINHLRGLFVTTFVRAILILSLSFLLIEPLGILALGVAIFVSELLSSVIIPGAFAQRTLQSNGSGIPLNVRLIAIVPICLTAVYYYAATDQLPGNMVIGVVAAVGTIIVAMVQWKQLGTETKTRILRVTRLSKFTKAT